MVNKAKVNLKGNDYQYNTIVSDELIKLIDEANKNQQSINKLTNGQSIRLVGLATGIKVQSRKDVCLLILE